MAAFQSRNFKVLLTQGVFNNAGYAFSSDRLVLPFLFAAAGGPAIFAGVIMPLVIVCKLASQLVGAPAINRARSGKAFISVATAILALALAAVSLLFDRLPPDQRTAGLADWGGGDVQGCFGPNYGHHGAQRHCGRPGEKAGLTSGAGPGGRGQNRVMLNGIFASCSGALPMDCRKSNQRGSD